jgi:prolyl oligopeptidase
MIRTSSRAPGTVRQDLVEMRHGQPVADPFRWLEGDNRDPARMGQVTPEVAAWTDEQNAHTRRVLDALPGRAAVERRLRPLLEVGAVSLPDVRGDRYFYARREGSQDQPVIYWREGHGGRDRVLIDPHALDASGLTTVEWVAPSADGRLAAYGTFTAGDENTTLRLIEVDSGRSLELEIPDRTQAPAWLPDGSGFVYRNLRDAHDPYSGQVRFHRMGTGRAGDALLARQFTRDEDERLATTWGPFATLSRDGRWLFLGYWVDTASNDAWLIDFDEFRRTGRADRIEVTVGAPGQAFGTVIDGVLYLKTTKGAPRGRVIAVDARNPGQARWRELVPERADAVIEGIALAQGLVAVTYLRSAANEVDVFDLEGRSRGRLGLPGIGSAMVAAEPDRTEAFVQFTSFNAPSTIYRVDLADLSAGPAIWARPEAPVDPEAVEVRQVWYPSTDDTRISMFIVHRAGFEKTGRAPTLLTGYGGFNISMTPAFSAPLFQWLESGGVYAVPNLRGGGEYGDAWHEAGMRERKQQVFDDFIAAAGWLESAGYTDSRHLAIAGGSNGGLLTGAVITQRPALCRAAIVAVPLLDMLRYQDFLMARYWVPEYGTAEDARAFEFLSAYSPYHRVEPGVAYPAVLLTAGEHDTRVHAMHARKMAAALQAASTSDPADQPVLLWVDREAGHGQGKPLALRLRDAVDQRIFLMWQLGMLPDQSDGALAGEREG